MAGVLAERVPLAAVTGEVGAERLANRAPHAVGGDHVAAPDRAQTVDLDVDVIVASSVSIDANP